jgi:pentatricopeptide repeat protein
LYPAHPEANRNLALLYLQQGRKDKARKILENMKTNGLEVPADLLERSK